MQEFSPSPSLENLLRVAQKSASWQALALNKGLRTISSQSDGGVSAEGRGYSLTSADANALCEALFRDTNQITDLIAQASR